MRFLLTTDPGLEDLLEEEIGDRVAGSVDVERVAEAPGVVIVEVPAVDRLLRLGMVYHVTEIRAESRACDLDELREALGNAAFDELAEATSFRVSSTCAGGTHLDRMDVERAGGAVLVGRYGTTVDLSEFEVNVRVDIYGSRLIAGVQQTRRSLGNRIERGKALRSSLKPTLAVAMLRLAGAHRGRGRLIDPMCGAGVIPVEAVRLNPELVVEASDWDPETVEVARATFANHEIAVEPRVAEARLLGVDHAAAFDYIVTDPPYGLRQARRTGLTALYRSLLRSFAGALRPGGRLVMIVVKYRVLLAALEESGLRVKTERAIASTGIQPRIYVLEREPSAGSG